MLKADTNASTKRKALEDMDSVLCLNLMEAASRKAAASAESASSGTGVSPELAEEIRAKIQERADAKKAKDYARADAIRNELAARGILLIDSKDGTTFQVK